MGLFGLGKKKEENLPDNSKSSSGKFVGFVLTKSEFWDREKFTAYLKTQWDLTLIETKDGGETNEENPPFLAADGNGNMVAVMSVNAPVPNEEAEYYARGNYTWRDAESVVKSHTAHLILMIIGKDGYENGKLFVKTADALLQQDNSLALYADGAVFSPQMYHDSAELMRNGGLPVLNWVWLGIHQNETSKIVYTYGMRKLGFEEMEYIRPAKNSDMNEFNDMRSMMLNIVSYVLNERVVFQDGETVGLTAEQKLPITYGKGITVDGNTLKITDDN